MSTMNNATIKPTSKQRVHNGAVNHVVSKTVPISSLSWVTLLLATSIVSGLNVQRPIQARLGVPGSAKMGDGSKFNGQILTRSPQKMKLLYSHGDFSHPDGEQRRAEHQSAVTGLRTRMSSWWTNVFPVAELDPEDPQTVVDDYLEFLDRRYHRLHDDDVEPVPASTNQFSALDWLLDKDSKHTQATLASSQSDEDALFVLGVAELASERLLQKHHIPLTAEAVIDTKASRISSAASSGLFGSTSNQATSVLQSFRQRRRALIAYEEKQIKRVALTCARAAALAPLGIVKTAEAVWRHGGGKKTFAMTLGLLTGLFLLIRPAMAAVLGVVFE